MKHSLRAAVLILGCLGLVTPHLAGRGQKEPNPPPQIRDFLKLTAYAILPQEKEVLLKLETERDRDVFIESFWKERDPTPGTPQNEFKDELIKRFQYVNKFYSRSTTREGWMTDRGRIYMILGEPASHHDFSGRPGLQPCEVWYYYGDVKKGLPPYFGLVFFQRRGAGELRLYDPVSDGMASLMTNTGSVPFDDYLALYERLVELAPDLAPVALSILPGDIPANFMPSPREAILLANILDLPKKAVNPSYATHFLDYKAMVSTEYMSNFVDSTACVDFAQDPLTGLTFLHFSIAPKTVSFDFHAPKGQHFCNLQLNVSLRQGQTVVFQYAKDFPVYISQEEADRIAANGISVEDAFPVIEGRYRLVVLLQNSVGKEFTIYERDVEPPASEARVRLAGLSAGYGVREYGRDISLPFALLGTKLLVDPSRTISSKESLFFFLSLSGVTEAVWKEGRVAITIAGSKSGPSGPKTLTIPLRAEPLGRTWVHFRSLSPGELPPDYYTMTATLLDGSGQALDERASQFIVSPLEEIPHPVAQAKMIRAANPAPYYVMLAGQAEKAGRTETAEDWYERALASSPDGRRGAVEYARLLLKAGQPEKSLTVIERIKDDPALRFDYFLTKGRAAMALGRTAEAVEDLLQGNKIYNSDTLLLNSLGTCYVRLGQKDKALTALRASLRLDPKQDEIRKLVAEIEKTPLPRPAPSATT
jgi:GWxTD domain-containing protein